MVEIRNLSVGYQGTSILSDINLSFPPGEITILVGPNGCGKSTLLQTVLGLQPKISGQISMDGRDTATISPREIAQNISYLAQSRNIPAITAQRMVLHGRFPYLPYPRRYSSKDKEIAWDALVQLGAEDLAHRPMTQLSGGQRQRVYLAMVLAQDTPTILMDEPTTFLDMQYQLEVMSVARTLADQGHAVVMVLHDLCLALRYGHRIALFSDGKLQQVGTPEAVYTSGILDDIFHIQLSRIQTESGWLYYYQ